MADRNRELVSSRSSGLKIEVSVSPHASPLPPSCISVWVTQSDPATPRQTLLEVTSPFISAIIALSRSIETCQSLYPRLANYRGISRHSGYKSRLQKGVGWWVGRREGGVGVLMTGLIKASAV